MRYRECSSFDLGGKCLIKAFYSTVPQGKRIYREHNHAECEISTFINGNGVYGIDNNSYSFSKGDVFVFAGNENHCITDIDSKFELLNLHFIPGNIFSSSEELGLVKIFTGRNNLFTNKIDRENPATEEIHRSIIKIHSELEDKNDGYSIMAKMHLCSILVSLIRNFNYVDTTVDFSSYEASFLAVSKSINYINSNLSDKLTLEEIASFVNMNPTYFSSIFKKLNGISVWDYIITKRVEKAVSLLKTTDLKKLDIAFECGFSSSSNFYKEFFKVTGKKPSDFTKNKSRF